MVPEPAVPGRQDGHFLGLNVTSCAHQFGLRYHPSINSKIKAGGNNVTNAPSQYAKEGFDSGYAVNVCEPSEQE